MRSLVSSICILLVILLILAEAVHSLNEQRYNRADFPPNFIFGSGTSAYQVEGAAAEDGRTPSVWDTSAHSGSSKENGDRACDQYHKYKEDVKLMVDTGLEAYRFSISWSRLIPNGRGPINPKGLQYYNNLINELISNGIQPHVTLFHYDLPQKLEDEYGGWRSRKIVYFSPHPSFLYLFHHVNIVRIISLVFWNVCREDFKAYANVCFREFGDRVSHWTTLIEANVFALGAYDVGIFPPKRCSSPFGWFHCTEGDSTTEPYIVAHNLLLAHASASTLYKKKYQAKQHGYIGLNIFTYFFVPLTNTTEDVEATQRANDFYIGWFIDPLMFGDYPSIMKKNVGSRLPSFTPHESKQVKGSYDFIGLNHYEIEYIKDNQEILKTDFRDAVGDMAAKILYKSNPMALSEFPVDAWGLQGTLEYFKQHYGNPPVFIQENGQVTSQTSSINDTSRVEYLDGYVGSLLNAVRNGSDTRGYFTWSFMDLFELLDGYGSRYGLYYVNFSDPNLKRTPKLSAHWYSNFLKGGSNDYWILEAQKNISFLFESSRSVE